MEFKGGSLAAIWHFDLRGTPVQIPSSADVCSKTVGRMPTGYLGIASEYMYTTQKISLDEDALQSDYHYM